MKNWLAVGSVFAAIATLPAFGSSFGEKLVSSSLEDVVGECTIAEISLEDYAACPIIHKYKFKNLSKEKAVRFLEERFALDTKETTAKEAVAVLRESMDAQVGNLVELLEDLKEEVESLHVAATQYEKSIPVMIAAFTNAAKGRLVLVDPDTYWAPSVNARAMAIVDLTKKTVTVILHGDTDG